jgi:hypothetical protein
MRDGAYKRADELVSSDSLMPYYSHIEKSNKKYSSEPRDTRGYNNHKVVSVRKIELDTPQYVYDLSVSGHQNFALEAGIFVHNCKADTYWGPEYIKTQYGAGDKDKTAQFGVQQDKPPVIRNPKKYGIVCKHAHDVLMVLPMYSSTFGTWLNDFYGKEIQTAVDTVKMEEEKPQAEAPVTKGKPSKKEEMPKEKPKGKKPVEEPEEEGDVEVKGKEPIGDPKGGGTVTGGKTNPKELGKKSAPTKPQLPSVRQAPKEEPKSEPTKQATSKYGKATAPATSKATSKANNKANIK